MPRSKNSSSSNGDKNDTTGVPDVTKSPDGSVRSVTEDAETSDAAESASPSGAENTSLKTIHKVQNLDYESSNDETKGAWDYQPPPPPVTATRKCRGSSLKKIPEASTESIRGSKNSDSLPNKPKAVVRQSELPEGLTRAGAPSTTASFASPRQSHAEALSEIRNREVVSQESTQSILELIPVPSCAKDEERVIECNTDIDPKSYVQEPNEPALITFKPPAECTEVKKNCDGKGINIILGESEKESVRSIGRELLLMGRRILDEIDMAESFKTPDKNPEMTGRNRTSDGESRRSDEKGNNRGKCTSKNSKSSKNVESSITSIHSGNSRSLRHETSVSFDENLPHKDELVDEPVETPQVSEISRSPSSQDETVQTDRAVEMTYADWAEEIQKSKLAFIRAFDQLCVSLGKMGAPIGEIDQHNAVSASQVDKESQGTSRDSARKSATRNSPSLKSTPEKGSEVNLEPKDPKSEGLPQGTKALQLCTSKDSCVDGSEIISQLKQLTIDVSTLTEKVAELDGQVGIILASMESMLTSLLKQKEDQSLINQESKESTVRMERLEGDLLKLMKLVYEMQCAQKLQMHFGLPSQGDSSDQQ